MADLTGPIQTAATSPETVSADGVTVTGVPLADMIAADRYLKSATASKNPLRGIRLSKIVPPGTDPGTST